MDADLPYHDEAMRVLAPLANRVLGERIRVDRPSQLGFLGIRTPVLRDVVEQGFSFYDQPDVLRCGVGCGGVRRTQR